MKASRLFAAAAPLALLLAACGGGQTGKVSVLLKDAPGDVSAAFVTISEIDLVGSGGTTVLRSTQTDAIDLTKLANQTADLVKDVDVPVGTYSQLRFVISGACIDVGGAIYATAGYAACGATVAGTLGTPSLAQSGLKIDLPGGAVEVGTTAHVLLVDFDVSQSYGHPAGSSGAWEMHPVVKATEIEFTGTLNVTVQLAAGVTLPAGTTVVLTPAVAGDAPTAALTPSSTPGTFVASFVYLSPGAYTLALSAPATVPATVTSFATTPALPADVSVTSGQATAVSLTVTSVTVL